MKDKILPILLIGMAMECNTTAFADTTSSAAINLNGNVANTCFIAGTPTAIPTSGATWFTTLNADNSTINISNFVDEHTAKLKSTLNSITLYFPKVYCNSAHSISVTSQRGGMRNNTPTAPGSKIFFTNVINYRITASLNNSNGSASITTLGTMPAPTDFKNINSASIGSMDIDITISPSFQTDVDKPLLAGTFSDTAKVTLGPKM